jgi:hypothetical protein
MKWTSSVVLGAAIAAFGLAGETRAVALTNPGFDLQNASGGDIYGSTGWGAFNDAYTHASPNALSAPNDLKIFGPFFQFGGAGVVQGGFAASAGQLWEASAWARSETGDRINGDNFAVVKIEFLDAGSTVIGSGESTHITNVTLPPDTWLPFAVQALAPANTATAQIVLVHVQLNNPVTGGSIFFDNAALGVVPEPASATLIGLAFAGMFGLVRRRHRA